MNCRNWIRIGLLINILCACNDSESNSFILNEQGEYVPVFADFDNFPAQQYLTLSLGDTNEEIVRKIGYLKVEPIAVTEVFHFYFPTDSTEIIIPDTPLITEISIFLKGRYYLENEPHFYGFFKAFASNSVHDLNFSIFEFSTERLNYKMSYFRQPDFIRLHFTLRTPNS